MNTFTTKRPYRILRDNTQATLIDVQEKLIPHIDEYQPLIKKISTLIQGLQALDIPIMVNEQYKKGLGETLPELTQILSQTEPKSFEKVTFSACDNDVAWHHLAQQNRNQVLLFGIEAHVCVIQTALDLLDNGMHPILVADAVGSRNPYDKQQAIERMRQSGVVITTVEAILFELCRSAKDPAFKTISQLVK